MQYNKEYLKALGEMLIEESKKDAPDYIMKSFRNYMSAIKKIDKNSEDYQKKKAHLKELYGIDDILGKYRLNFKKKASPGIYKDGKKIADIPSGTQAEKLLQMWNIVSKFN